MVSRPSIWRLLSVLLYVATASAATSSTSVSSDTDLQSALVDDSIQEIVVEQDIVFDRGNWVNWYSRSQPYIRRSNLTIRGFPPLRKLDFAFTGDGRYELDAGVYLNISDIILEHARYAATASLTWHLPYHWQTLSSPAPAVAAALAALYGHGCFGDHCRL